VGFVGKGIFQTLQGIEELRQEDEESEGRQPDSADGDAETATLAPSGGADAGGEKANRDDDKAAQQEQGDANQDAGRVSILGRKGAEDDDADPKDADRDAAPAAPPMRQIDPAGDEAIEGNAPDEGEEGDAQEDSDEKSHRVVGFCEKHGTAARARRGRRRAWRFIAGGGGVNAEC